MKLPNKKAEGHVKTKVKALLNAHEWFWWMTPANGYNVSGIADFCAVRPGVLMVVETKSIHTTHGRGGPTVLQQGFLNSIRAAKHFAFVVNEDTLIHFQRFLELFEIASVLKQQNKPIGPEIGGPLLDCIKALSDWQPPQDANV